VLRKLPVALLSLYGILTTFAISRAQTHAEILELHLRPDPVKRGAPRTFSLLLVNKTRHDVYVPAPRRNCEDSYDGWFQIAGVFKPLTGTGEEPLFTAGCAADSDVPTPPILDRIKEDEWQILHLGESLNLGSRAETLPAGVTRTLADRARMRWEVVPRGAPPRHFGTVAFHDYEKPGTYEFWARYLPPSISSSEQAILRRANIDVPNGELISNHLVFAKTK
jgi:hypothetical protein